jgi:hypothetical protein
MKNRKFKSSVLLLVVSGVLALGAGCNELAAGGLTTFGLGFLVGRLTTPTTTQTECYVNGEQVDCSTLPE